MLYSAAIIDNNNTAIDSVKKVFYKRTKDVFKAPILLANTYNDALDLLFTHGSSLDVVFLDLDLNDDEIGQYIGNNTPSGLTLLEDYQSEMQKKDTTFFIPFSVVIVTHYEKLHGLVANYIEKFPCILSLVSKSEYLGRSFDDQLNNAIELLNKRFLKTKTMFFFPKLDFEKRIIRLEDILYIEAQNTNSIIHTQEGDNIPSNKSLKEIDEQKYSLLYRCHKQYIINIPKVIAFNPAGKGRGNPTVTMKNEELVRVSRGKTGGLKKLLGLE